jgi:hypothetical protein
MTVKKLEHGFLYIAVNSFPAKKGNQERRVFVEKGEVIEFRFFYPANFRTQDDLYLKCEEECFLKNTKVYGKIWDNVFFRNGNSLKQILECKLYDKVKED